MEHKHAEVLRAIADGREVEALSADGWMQAVWMKVAIDLHRPAFENPISRPDWEWRVKPSIIGGHDAPMTAKDQS